MKRAFLLLGILCLVAIPTKVSATEVTPNNFLQYFNLVGSAMYDPTSNVVTLTTEDRFQVGSITLNQKISTKSSFSLIGKINLGAKSPLQKGADGIGIAFHTGNTSDIGGAAGDLGVIGLIEATGFVLDSYKNTNINDPDVPYGAFLKTDISGNKLPGDFGLVDYQLIPSTLYDSQFHDFSIYFDGDKKIFSVTFGGQSWSTQSGYSTALAFSASASTGTSNNKQQISISSFQYKLASAVLVHYFDDTGNEIHPKIIVNGNVGDTYDVSGSNYRLSIPGFTLNEQELPINATGVITEDILPINYYYTKNPIAGGDVTAQYQDTEGNTISPNIIKTGNIGDTYTTEQLTIEGYTYKEVIENSTGTFTEDPQIVTYVYTKNPIAGSDVTARYQDTEGNTISLNIIKTGNIGDTYTTEQLTIEGYTYKEVIGNSIGTIISDPQTVIYVYTKNDIEKPIKPSESGTIANLVGQKKPNNSNTYTKGLPETGEKTSILFMILGITTLVAGAYIFNKKRVNSN